MFFKIGLVTEVVHLLQSILDVFFLNPGVMVILINFRLNARIVIIIRSGLNHDMIMEVVIFLL